MSRTQDKQKGVVLFEASLSVGNLLFVVFFEPSYGPAARAPDPPGPGISLQVPFLHPDEEHRLLHAVCRTDLAGKQNYIRDGKFRDFPVLLLTLSTFACQRLALFSGTAFNSLRSWFPLPRSRLAAEVNFLADHWRE
jgi:hypothetical protein